LNFADSRSSDNLAAFFSPGEQHKFMAVSAPKTADFFLNDQRAATDPDDDGDDK